MKARKVGQSNATLTFAWLHKRVQEYVTAASRPAPPKIERWCFWIGIASAGMGVIVGTTWSHWLSGTDALSVMKVLLAGEIAGLLLSAGLAIRRELPQFLRSREVHADEMDGDFRR